MITALFWFIPAASVLALLFAWFFFKRMMTESEGTPLMAKIAHRRRYDTGHLIRLLRSFKTKYPALEIILEPGSAFVWQTGFLLTTVTDIVESGGIKTAIIDASFACHMPDCLEMPYKPVIRYATDAIAGKPVYRIGGSSCLAGDFYNDYKERMS